MRTLGTALVLTAAAFAAAGTLGEAAGQETVGAAAVRIEGTIVDASSGDALAGARVRVLGHGERLSDERGNFLYEALPTGRHVMVVGREGYITVSGDLEVLRPGDLTLALEPGDSRGSRGSGGSGRARLMGRVVDEITGGPIADVQVRIEETGAVAVTDGDGRFAFPPGSPGSYSLTVERLGYTSAVRRVEVGGGEALDVMVTIPADPVPLEEITVAVDARSLPLVDAGFYDRMEHGSGIFLTPEALEPKRVANTSDILAELPGVRIQGSAQYPNIYIPVVVFRGGERRGCGPVLWIDGIRMPREEDRGPIPIDRYVDPSAILGMEVYRSAVEIPPRYNTPDAACGVLVIWTGATR